MEKLIIIAGATGYLGGHMVRAFAARGWKVRALARPGTRATFPDGVEVFHAEATRPETLQGLMRGADAVVSSLGITRQKGPFTYEQVDYQANLNLLKAAMQAGVPRFGYVHVMTRGGEKSALIAAKARFVAALKQAPIASLVVRPNGFFADLKEVLDMAQGGRVWLVGSGRLRLNPIDGADLARVIADALETGETDIEVGGPEALSLNEIAQAAFGALGRPARISHVPRWLAVGAVSVLRRVTPQRIWGPIEFFLDAAAGETDAVGPSYGTRTLGDFFRDEALG